MSEIERKGLRIDRVLVYLRFVRTRSAASALIEGRSLRLNRKRVQRASALVAIGDVLTIGIGNDVRVVEVVSLPERRTSASSAKTHYNELARS
ncbi:MAG: S4 domain-containing protein [Pseudomonadota bacterium]